MKKKKLTFIVLHLGHGGIQKSVAIQANILSKYFKVKIVVVYKLSQEAGYYINDNVEITYLTDLEPNRLQMNHHFKQKNYLRLTSELIKAVNILFHKNNSAKKFLKTDRSDVIISTRAIFNKNLSQFGFPDSVKIAQEHREHNDDLKYIKKIVRDSKELDWFLPVSLSLVDDYEYYFRDAHVKVDYMPNAFGKETKLMSNHEKGRIISVGRISPEKGFFDLIDVYSELIKLTKNWHAVIVGDGKMLEDLKLYTISKNLQNYVEFTGYLEEVEVHKELMKSSLFVMASKEESFGISMLEAFSFGVPAVVFDDANGFKEIISNTDSGYLISNRDKRNMAKKIFELLNDSQRLEAMSHEAYDRSLSFTDKAVEERWLEFFKEKIGYTF